MENKSGDNKRFFKFFHDIIESSTWAKLSLAAKAVYPVIAKYTNFKTGESFPSLSTISKDAGLHRESVVNAIKDLVNAGLIIKRQGNARESNHYQLIYYYTGVGLTDYRSRDNRLQGSIKPTAAVQIPNSNYINITNSNISISKDKIVTNISIEKEIVDGFYNNLGLKASRVKREQGYKIAKNLLDEGYNKDDLRYSVDWALINLKDKINSFSLIPHIIDQALRTQKKENDKNRLNIQQKKELLEERKRKEERINTNNHINRIKNMIAKNELVSFENEARAILKQVNPDIKGGPIFNILLQLKIGELILKKYPINKEGGEPSIVNNPLGQAKLNT